MTDSNEPTPWEEINPPMVSAPRHGLPRRLRPSGAGHSDVFRNELTACLTLVAPAGMTEEARRDWLAVAWGTLKHLPPDILAIGCKKARETCDHPSKIVPTILAETKEGCRPGARLRRTIRQRQVRSASPRHPARHPLCPARRSAADGLRRAAMDPTPAARPLRARHGASGNRPPGQLPLCPMAAARCRVGRE
jgi:hypothetical protein